MISIEKGCDAARHQSGRFVISNVNRFLDEMIEDRPVRGKKYELVKWFADIIFKQRDQNFRPIGRY